MATYTNTVPSSSISTALGGPTLGVSDIIRINESSDFNFTDSLGSLGSTAIAEFYHDSGSHSNMGSGSDGVVIQAGIMYENSRAPSSLAYEGLGTGTVDLWHWEPISNPLGYLKDYEITKLRMMSGGLLTIMDTCEVVSAYLGGIGNHLYAEPGTAMTLAVLGNANQKVTLERDCAEVRLLGSRCALICSHASATPSTVEVRNHSRAQLLEGTVTIKAGGGAIIDLSRATGDFTITWVIDGDITIIEPPAGVSCNKPTDAQILSGTVKYA